MIMCNIPGVFMQVDMDKEVLLKLDGDIVMLLIQIYDSYQKFLVHENGKPMIYTQLDKALYDTLQAALLFWEDLSGYLMELGFAPNPYNFCVMNKMVDGNQCTVAWHVDDLKISHVDEAVAESVILALDKRYRKEAPLSVTQGKVHEYLGMTIDFSSEGSVQLNMFGYIDKTLAEAPDYLMKGPASTPAASHLFEVNDDAEKLDKEQSEQFHHKVAKLLYLSKQSRSDLQMAVSFLTTQVKGPNVDDEKKLGWCLRYLKNTQDLPLRLHIDKQGVKKWWVDASFVVHADYKSHTGASMSMGSGCPINISTKQKLNMCSSTEAELVGVNNAMAVILWMWNFLMVQGYEVTNNVIYQDNKSAVLLEENGRRSSGKKTRHIAPR